MDLPAFIPLFYARRGGMASDQRCQQKIAGHHMDRFTDAGRVQALAFQYHALEQIARIAAMHAPGPLPDDQFGKPHAGPQKAKQPRPEDQSSPDCRQ